MLPRLSLLLLLLAPTFAHAKPPDSPALDAAVAASMKAWSVPGAAVVIVHDGQVIYLSGHGVREVNKDGPVTPDTLFCLGSCSKAFTTAAMASLVAEGKLSWDDRVTEHLPTFRLSDDLVTRDVRLRDLLCHRTGLPSTDLLTYRAPWPPAESVERLAHVPLAKPFRTAFQYNNAAYTAAGFAAAKAAGVSWEDLVRQRLLVPLGMKRTCLDAAVADRDADRARPHRLDRLGEPKPGSTPNMRIPDPCGSVHSSARDLASWLTFHLDEGAFGGKQLIPARVLRQTHAPQLIIPRTENERRGFPDTVQSSYAMAWVVLDHRGQKVIAHGGALDGQRTQILLVPDKKLGIAVLSNLHQTLMNLALSFTLMERCLDLPKRRDWDALHKDALAARTADAQKRQRDRLARRKPDTKPSLALTSYAGTYEHEAFGKVRIAAARGGLTFEYRGDRAPLEHFHDDTYIVSDELPGEAEVVFHLDKKGVSGFTITGNLGATFTRSER